MDHVTTLVKVPNDMPVDLAATLTVNPQTAYRMLKAFVTLTPGGWDLDQFPGVQANRKFADALLVLAFVNFGAVVHVC